MTLVDRRVGMGFLVGTYALRGIGLGCLNAPSFTVATSGLNPQQARMGASLLSLCLVLGGTFGISLLTTLLERWQTIHQTHLAETQMAAAVGTQQALITYAELSQRLGLSPSYVGLYARGQLSAMLGREAFIHALYDCFALVSVLGIGCAALILTMRMVRENE